jgi:very-short-patch-repair endonuclease
MAVAVSIGNDGLARDWAGGSGFIRRVVGDLRVNMSLDAEDVFMRFVNVCESPIECIALAALLNLFPTAAVVKVKEELKGQEDWDFAIVPQMQFRGYRLDFGVLNRAHKTAFDLECDGRDFHRDKRRDGTRDVALWTHGVIAFHVSGSALCRNAHAALEPFARKVRGFA